MKRWDILGPALQALVVGSALSMSGCGEEKSQPITNLNEEQKKQVEELNRQRAQEWGNK